VPGCVHTLVTRESYAPSLLPCMVAFGALGRFGSLEDDARRQLNRRMFLLGCFLIFYRLYLTVCSMSDYPDHCFVHKLYDRLYSASSNYYVTAEAHFCWLDLFVANAGTI
jgi:hypothetical protein